MKKIIIGLVVISLLIFGYYFFMVAILKGMMNDFCQKKYCFDLLDLSDYLSISLALVGLVFVVKSLDSWKEQDKFFNARNLCNKLTSLKDLCDIQLLILIDQKEHEVRSLPLEEQRKALLNIFFEIQLFRLSEEISNILRHSNYLYKEDFNGIYSELNTKIHAMYNIIENEKKSFKNIQAVLHIAIRNEFLNLSKKLFSINQRLDKKANE